MASTQSENHSGVEVIEISDQEYEQSVRDALHDLGLTYAQLRAQARRGDFQSGRARRLWLAIGSADCA